MQRKRKRPARRPRDELGRAGEHVAAAYLRAKGYRILARNWRDGPREIDLVVADGQVLVIVEVKTRDGVEGGRPEESVNPLKRRHLARAAAAFAARVDGEPELRYDIVAVRRLGDRYRVLHLPDAFFPGG